MAEKEKLAFYNYDRLYSYNATYNILVGARGLGKTYGIKLKVIIAAIKKGDQFIYLRRYKEELKTSARTFFADIEREFPDHDFKYANGKAYMAPAETRDVKKRSWTHIGYFIALSQAQSVKGVSYPLVKVIIFDEFIIEKGMTHYLPDEAKAFNQFYSTVDRWQDRTKVFFLANAVSIQNPYFMEWGIEPKAEMEWIKKYKITTISPSGVEGRKDFIVCHFADSADFKAGVYKTAFGQFIEGTEYGDYAVGSEFSDNNDNLIQKKNPRATYQFTLETRGGVFSVWVDWNGPDYYIQTKLPKEQDWFTILPERVTEEKTLLIFSDKMLSGMRTAFRNGHAFFDAPRSRNAFIDIFRR